MMRPYLFLLVVLLSGIRMSAQVEHNWSLNAIAVTTNPAINSKDIKFDASGNKFMTGTLGGAYDANVNSGTTVINYPSAGLHMFLNKYNANDSLIYSIVIESVYPEAIDIKANGEVVVAGYYIGDPDFDPGVGVQQLVNSSAASSFIAIYSPNGALVDVYGLLSSGSISIRDMVLDDNENVCVTGIFSGIVDFDPSPAVANLTSTVTNDFFFAKYSASGAFVFAKALHGDQNESNAPNIAVDVLGNCILAGTIGSGTTDFDPDAGVANAVVSGSSQIYFAKYSSSGAYVFHKIIGSTGVDQCNAVVTDISNNIVITGGFSGTVDFDPNAGNVNRTSVGNIDFFTAKYSPTGTFVFCNVAGSSGTESGNDIDIDGSGNVLVGGTFTNTVDFDPTASVVNLVSGGSVDPFIVKYTSAGVFAYAIGITGSSSETLDCLSSNSSGNVYAGGTYFPGGNPDFDPGIGVVNISAIFNDECLYFSSYSSSGALLNAKGINCLPFGAKANDYAYAVHVDPIGNTFVAFDQASGYVNYQGTNGFFITPAISGNTVVKYDTSGVVQWVFQFSQVSPPTDITQDANGNLLVCGNGWIYGISPAGIQNFYVQALGNHSAIIAEASGAFYTAGSFTGTVDFDPGMGTIALAANGLTDAYFAKYSSTGSLIYVKQIGGSGADRATGIQINSSGQLVISGDFSSTVDFDPNSGTSNMTAVGSNNDGFVGLYSSTGQYINAKPLCVSNAQMFAVTLDLDQFGNIYVGGTYTGTADFDPDGGVYNLTSVSVSVYSIFICKWSSNLTFVNAISFGSATTSPTISELVCDPLGNVNVIGFHNNSMDIDPSGNTLVLPAGGTNNVTFVARYNTNGELIYGYQLAATVVEGRGIAVNSVGKLGICGSFYGTGDFDPIQTQQQLLTSTNSSNHDAFVSQLNQSFFTLNTTIINGSVACFGDSNGAAAVTPVGNQPPYTYLWAPTGATDSLVTNLPAGTHTVTVTDGFGLTITTTVTITSPSSPLTASVSAQSNVTCYGGTNGYAAIAVSGGTSPYTYAWSPSGGTGSSSSTLSAGTYTVTVTDANSCTSTVTLTITEPSELQLSVVSQVNVLCNGSATGAATVAASGGSGSNTYFWSPGNYTTTTATGLLANTYTVTVTDLNGCVDQLLVNITQPPVLTGSVTSITHINCLGGNDGAATITATGGQPGYSYSWSPTGGNAATANNLTAGNYTCTITDNNGCSAAVPVVILYQAPTQEICVVTVDTLAANHNVVIWEKPINTTNIDSFRVYREITLNNYQVIGAVHVDSLSEWHDYQANPNSFSYRYKVTVIDTCGGESPYSLYHASIHLQYLGLGNFQWTFYEIENTSNQVSSYNFYRDDVGNGNWVLLNIVPGNQQTFTDVNYTSYPNARYRVDVNWISQNICTPTMRMNSMAGINTSKSNIKNQTAQVSVQESPLQQMVQLYPNPASDVVYLQFNALIGEMQVTCYDALGQLVFDAINPSAINTGTWAAGVYTVLLRTEQMMTVKKITIQR